MTLEKFTKEILGEKAKNYSQEKIEKLFKISLAFSNSMFEVWKKENNSQQK